MQTSWILVADWSSARLFSIPGETGSMALLRQFVNRAEPFGGGPGPATVFAANLSCLLEEAAIRHGFQRLILVAPDEFLHMLSESPGTVSAHRLAWSMARDTKGLKTRQLEQLLGELLPGEPAACGN
jgi:hypothetical protein